MNCIVIIQFVVLTMTAATVSILGLAFLIGGIGAAAVPKIVGGENAWIKNYPYLVSIRVSGRHSCGGSIISDRHILTAAHCLEDYDSRLLRDVTVHSGTSRTDKEGNVHRVASVHSHPDYEPSSMLHYYDIAILTLKDPIEFNKYQKKIDLPKHDVQNYQAGYVAGWGRLHGGWNWDTPDQLQKVQVAMLPSSKCQRFVTRQLHEGQVCSFRTGTGTCHGDSGGPLVSKGELIGIVSYTEGGVCGEDVPDVYTNVYAYKDYIASIMKL